MHHLVGIAEIADMLGVSRQRVDAIARTDETFPPPEADLKGGRVWSSAAIEEWRRNRARGENPGE